MHVSKASYKACHKVHAILRRSQIYIVEIKKPTISERQKHINILNPKIIMEIAALTIMCMSLIRIVKGISRQKKLAVQTPSGSTRDKHLKEFAQSTRWHPLATRLFQFRATGQDLIITIVQTCVSLFYSRFLFNF